MKSFVNFLLFILQLVMAFSFLLLPFVPANPNHVAPESTGGLAAILGGICLVTAFHLFGARNS